jgi:HPt (histidine-containing phosphotransfer) domain-containing protein
MQQEAPSAKMEIKNQTGTRDGQTAAPESGLLSRLQELNQVAGKDTTKELVSLFFEDTGNQIAALRQAVERQDPATIKKVAHSLKGSSDNVGASRMAELCAELETLVRDGDLPGTVDASAALRAEFERVKPVLIAEFPETWS